MNKVCSPWISRLGYTYLRLKDNHMEILNKDDEIERLVLATELDVGQQPWKEPALCVSAITELVVVQKKASIFLICKNKG